MLEASKNGSLGGMVEMFELDWSVHAGRPRERTIVESILKHYEVSSDNGIERIAGERTPVR